MQAAQIYSTKGSDNSSTTHNEPKSTGQLQVLEMNDTFVKEEINRDFLEQEQQESERFHNTKVSSNLFTIKTEPDSHLEGQEPDADDIFVKEEMSLGVVKHEELEEVEIILLKTENVHEELNHTVPYTNDEIERLQKSQPLIDCTRRKQVSCEICNKEFARKGHLLEHMGAVHNGLKPFSCDICNKRFYHKRSLQNHLHLHTGEKLLSCDICNKKFSQKSHLQAHVRAHTGEKPFSCCICNRSFSQKSYLPVHVRVHTGEKPFSCEICNKTFPYKFSLQNHLRIHTGETPFSCDICNKTFSQKSSLQTHLRIHTGEKPFTCVVCNETYCYKFQLQKHVCVLD